MSERRMFTQKITESDSFLEMPMSSQALYFHCCMNADDDGFVKNPKRLARMIGASDDDLKLLMLKRFVLPFESGVIVIKHWRMHNLLRKDRYKETEYLEEKSRLYLKENGSYTFDENQGKKLMATNWQPNGNHLAPQDRLGKDSIVYKEESVKEESEHTHTKKFIKPTIEEIEIYCKERNNNIEPCVFLDFYESKGWKVGNQPMKDWKACIRTWERKEQKMVKQNQGYEQRQYDKKQLDSLFDDIDEIEI